MSIKELGKRIRTKREQQRLTQLQLANSLNISPQSVSKWERGESAPDITLLPTLSIVLDISLDALLTGQHPPSDQLTATIFVSSFREFAKKATLLTPKEIAHSLNGLFHPITKIILEANGIPIKYMGDTFLAYFSGKNHEKRAIQSGIRLAKLLAFEKILITACTGDICLAPIGTDEYANLDIIGTAVNTAFLLNNWANEHSTAAFVIADALYTAAKKPKEFSLSTGSFGSGVFELIS